MKRNGHDILYAKATKFKNFHFCLFMANGLLKVESLLQTFTLKLQLNVWLAKQTVILTLGT